MDNDLKLPGPLQMHDFQTPFVYVLGENGYNVFSFSLQSGGQHKESATQEELCAYAQCLVNCWNKQFLDG